MFDSLFSAPAAHHHLGGEKCRTSGYSTAQVLRYVDWWLFFTNVYRYIIFLDFSCETQSNNTVLSSHEHKHTCGDRILMMLREAEQNWGALLVFDSLYFYEMEQKILLKGWKNKIQRIYINQSCTAATYTLRYRAALSLFSTSTLFDAFSIAPAPHHTAPPHPTARRTPPPPAGVFSTFFHSFFPTTSTFLFSHFF